MVALSVKVPSSELPLQQTRNKKLVEISPSEADSSAISNPHQAPDPQEPPKPEFFTFEHMHKKHNFKPEARRVGARSASMITGSALMSKSPFSRSHLMEGHSSALRGSTVSALETDSDYSNEEKRPITRISMSNRDYFAEALLTSRARDNSRSKSRN